MLKLLKNLKKTWLSVVFIILLLCLQAATDLSLPDYTSKIVNVGIQQGGIESLVPEAMSKSSMQRMLSFTEDDNQILENYTLISKENLSQKDYKTYQNKYPTLDTEDIYVLKKLNKEEEENLEMLMSKPLLISYAMTMKTQLEGVQMTVENFENMSK